MRRTEMPTWPSPLALLKATTALVVIACTSPPCAAQLDQTCAFHAFDFRQSAAEDSPAVFTSLDCDDGPEGAICDMIGRSGSCDDVLPCADFEVTVDPSCGGAPAATTCCLLGVARPCPGCSEEAVVCIVSCPSAIGPAAAAAQLPQLPAAVPAAAPGPAAADGVATEAVAELSGAAAGLPTLALWSMLGVCVMEAVALLG